MIIDFHTHVFPDKIADRTIKKLEDIGGSKAYTNGTLQALKKSMKDNDVDYSIVLPVVTNPEQFDSVNSYACKITGEDGIISFGGIHPDSKDYKLELEKIKQMGLLGIKLHPDYQETYIDDEKMVRLIEYATKIGLIIVIHSGVDIGLPNPVHCTPKRAAIMLESITTKDPKIVFAHTGGYRYWDEVEEYIMGKNVWIDISYSLGMMPDDQFLRIVKNHGTNHVLFASDSPWSDQKETADYLKKLDLDKNDLNKIFYQNAKDLLGME